MEPSTQQQRLVALNKTLSWAKVCKQLVIQPSWAELVAKIEADIDEVGKQFTSLRIKPERLEITAERADSRRSLIQEIEQAASQVEALEGRFQSLNKIVNK